MRVYRVIDDGTEVLATVNELEALRRLRLIMEKHDVTYGWVEEMEVK
jgi:hypothetical protein